MISRQAREKNPERVTEPVESKGWKMGFLGSGGGRKSNGFLLGMEFSTLPGR
jgi:hypothetical protein